MSWYSKVVWIISKKVGSFFEGRCWWNTLIKKYHPFPRCSHLFCPIPICTLYLYKNCIMYLKMPKWHLEIETILTVLWTRLCMYDYLIQIVLHTFRFLNTLHLQSINHKEQHSFSNYLQLSCSTSRFILRYKRLTAQGENKYAVRMDDTSRLQPLFYFRSQREICSLSKKLNN